MIFYAPTNLETVDRTLECIRKKRPFFPVSVRELDLPSISLPNSGFLLSTSGSSGYRKLAHLSFENLSYSALYSHPDLKLTPKDNYLLSVPINHISGLSIINRCHLSGAKIILPNQGKDHEVTHVSFVPTQLKRFLQNPSLYPKLKAILLGGAPIPYELCMETYAKGIPLYITYGMTEMSSQICTRPFDPKIGITFGLPVEHRELKIVEGEIFVRGKTLFHGYHNHPSPFIDGWFPTKDLGILGPHGLELLGRKDRMFISGGENIHPEEIERALLSHPLITRAKVDARKDPEYGARPTATLETSLSKDAIFEYLKSQLPKFKIPAKDDITLNPTDYHFGK